jgi:hypothetical protein
VNPHKPLVQLGTPFVTAGHEAQVNPPLPHEETDSEANTSHVPDVPPLQHPVAQSLASQTHAPAELHV